MRDKSSLNISKAECKRYYLLRNELSNNAYF